MSYDPTATRRFMQSVFKGLEGWTPISFWADAQNNNWTPHRHGEGELRGNQWFHLPTDFGKMMAFIKANRKKDLYFTPYVYADASSRAAWNATHTRAVTIDADDCHPDKFLKAPTWSWETSPGSFQAIWLLPSPVGAEDAQGVGRAISTHHTSDGADGSGWDVGQLLRIPHGSTHNKDHKSPHIVGNLKRGPFVYSIASLSKTYPPMEVAKIIRAENVQVIEIPTRRIPMDIRDGIERTATNGDRSTARWGFILDCCKRGYADGEILYLLSLHKITQELESEQRRNWTQLYLDQIQRARLKHPHEGKRCIHVGCDGKGNLKPKVTLPDNVVQMPGTEPAEIKAQLPAISIPVAASKEDLQAVIDQGEDYWSEQRKKLDMSVDFRHVHFAEFVADQCGKNLMYVEGIGWHVWNGMVWELAMTDRPVMAAVTTASQRLAMYVSGDPSNREWAMKACSKMLVHGARNAIVNEMKNLDSLNVHVSKLDTKRDLLAFKNGTVELRTGTLRAHDREDYLTQCAPIVYNPNAKCPRWLRFVTEIFPNDRGLQTYYQKFLGMSITGEVKDHVLGVWYGDKGRNGKGVTIHTMQHLFGSQLIKEVPFSTFEKERGQQPHTEVLAGMRGARMVVAQEGNPDVPMNVALLKTLSGGDAVPARHLYGKQFVYDPTFTLVLVTNELPDFSAGGTALWARTRAIPFAVSFIGREDKNLENVLHTEAEGIAAWVVQGAVSYYRDGLGETDAVSKATRDFAHKVSVLSYLEDDLFVYDPKARVKRSEFNKHLKAWRERNGITPRDRKFSQSAVKVDLLSQDGVAEATNFGHPYFTGIRLVVETKKEK